MSLRIEETFQVRAPVDRVWRYLVDPRQVVECLPGAELTGVQDDHTYLGRVKVKVGPITAGYNGRATVVEQDDVARVVRIAAEGRETAGSGSAKMTMTSRMTVLADGTTEVHVLADVDVVGKVVQFGRGMIEGVSRQLFKQFTDCARARLEVAEAAPPAGAAAVDVGAPSALALPAAAPPVAELTVDATPPVGAAAAVAAGVVTPTPLAGTRAAARAEPVKLLPLVFRALREMIARLWRPRRA
jgi:hypothetical protein